jgi:hypothetical protein
MHPSQVKPLFVHTPEDFAEYRNFRRPQHHWKNSKTEFGIEPAGKVVLTGKVRTMAGDRSNKERVSLIISNLAKRRLASRW